MPELRAKLSLDITPTKKALAEVRAEYSQVMSRTVASSGNAAAQRQAILQPYADALANLRRLRGEYQTLMSQRGQMGEMTFKKARASMASEMSQALAQVRLTKPGEEEKKRLSDLHAILKQDKVEAQELSKQMAGINWQRSTVKADTQYQVNAQRFYGKQVEAEQRKYAISQLYGHYEMALQDRLTREAEDREAREKRIAKIHEKTQALVAANQVRLNQIASQPTTLFGKLKAAFSGVQISDVLQGSGGMGGALGMAMAGGATAGAVGGAVAMAVQSILSMIRRVFAGIKEGLLDVLSFVRQLQNFRAQTGIGYGTAAVFSRASEMAGLDPNAMMIWWSRFQANLTNIRKIEPGVSAALMRLNIPFAALRKMSPEGQMMTLIRGYNRLKNQADQAGVSMALFNRQGAELLRLFRNQGLFKEAVQQLGSLGKITDEEGDKMAMLSRAWEGLQYKTRGFFYGMEAPNLDKLTDAASAINQLDLAGLGKSLGQSIQPFVNSTASAAESLQRIADMMERITTLARYLPSNLITKGAVEFYQWQFDTAGKVMDYLLGIKREPKEIPKIKGAGQDAALSAVFDYRTLFGRGPGDQWSKLGAFSTPGGTNPIHSGLNFQQQIAQNTKEMVMILRGKVVGTPGGGLRFQPGAFGQTPFGQVAG